MPKPTLEVLIRCNATGEERIYKETGYDLTKDGCAYMWRDGSYECDCNRHLFFHRANGRAEDGSWEYDFPCNVNDENRAYTVPHIVVDGERIEIDTTTT